jgi:hypothetical protein
MLSVFFVHYIVITVIVLFLIRQHPESIKYKQKTNFISQINFLSILKSYPLLLVDLEFEDMFSILEFLNSLSEKNGVFCDCWNIMGKNK